MFCMGKELKDDLFLHSYDISEKPHSSTINQTIKLNQLRLYGRCTALATANFQLPNLIDHLL
jgi:hypothetical protein